MPILHTLSYRDVIAQKLKENKNVRGYKSKIAHSLGIQNSYLSHILKGTADLTPDHAAILCEMWGLDDRDTDYFLTLVNFERASAPSLKARLKKRLVDIANQSYVSHPSGHDPLELRDVGLVNGIEFFSDWIYSAIYSALDIPEVRTASALAERIEISRDRVEKYLQKLLEMDFVEFKDGGWTAKPFAPTVSSRTLRVQFTKEWRKRALRSNQNGDSDGTFVTLLGAIPKEDYLAIRSDLLALVDRFEAALARDNPSEVLIFGFDYFRLGRPDNTAPNPRDINSKT